MLALAVLIALFLSLLFASVVQRERSPRNKVDRALAWVRLYACFDVVIGAIFWSWSLFHISEGVSDSGVVSFAFPLAAGVNGLCVGRFSSRHRIQRHKYLIIVSHLFVGLSYVAGCVQCLGGMDHCLKAGMQFVVYCVLGANGWLVTGYVFSRQAHKLAKAMEDDSDVQYEDATSLVGLKSAPNAEHVQDDLVQDAFNLYELFRQSKSRTFTPRIVYKCMLFDMYKKVDRSKMKLIDEFLDNGGGGAADWSRLVRRVYAKYDWRFETILKAFEEFHAPTDEFVAGFLQLAPMPPPEEEEEKVEQHKEATQHKESKQHTSKEAKQHKEAKQGKDAKQDTKKESGGGKKAKKGGDSGDHRSHSDHTSHSHSDQGNDPRRSRNSDREERRPSMYVDAAKEGHLYKKSSGDSSWHKRFFMVNGHYLNYYADEARAHDEKRDVSKSFDLRQCTKIVREGDTGEKITVRLSSAANKDYSTKLKLQAKSFNEATAWIQAMSSVCPNTTDVPVVLG